MRSLATGLGTPRSASVFEFMMWFRSFDIIYLAYAHRAACSIVADSVQHAAWQDSLLSLSLSLPLYISPIPPSLSPFLYLSIAGIICNEIILFALRNGLHFCHAPRPFFWNWLWTGSIFVRECVCDSTSHFFDIERERQRYNYYRVSFTICSRHNWIPVLNTCGS